jgi:hypothetical protein
MKTFLRGAWRMPVWLELAAAGCYFCTGIRNAEIIAVAGRRPHVEPVWDDHTDHVPDLRLGRSGNVP